MRVISFSAETCRRMPFSIMLEVNVILKRLEAMKDKDDCDRCGR